MFDLVFFFRFFYFPTFNRFSSYYFTFLYTVVLPSGWNACMIYLYTSYKISGVTSNIVYSSTPETNHKYVSTDYSHWSNTFLEYQWTEPMLRKGLSSQPLWMVSKWNKNVSTLEAGRILNISDADWILIRNHLKYIYEVYNSVVPYRKKINL